LVHLESAATCRGVCPSRAPPGSRLAACARTARAMARVPACRSCDRATLRVRVSASGEAGRPEGVGVEREAVGVCDNLARAAECALAVLIRRLRSRTETAPECANAASGLRRGCQRLFLGVEGIVTAVGLNCWATAVDFTYCDCAPSKRQRCADNRHCGPQRPQQRPFAWSPFGNPDSMLPRGNGPNVARSRHYKNRRPGVRCPRGYSRNS